MLQKLFEVSGSNHFYCTRYINFIKSRTRTDGLNDYSEDHHILPKANTLFPEYASFNENPWNKAVLTPREHFIAHWMLWKAVGNFMAYAFLAMNRTNKVQTRYFNLSSKVYAELRKDMARVQANRHISKETRQRMSESQKHREKITCPHCNTTTNQLNAKKYHFDKCKSITKVNKHIVKQNHDIVMCPHCGKEGKEQGMLASHFDNCYIVRGEYRKITTEVECPHCHKIGKDCNMFREYHFDNCEYITGIAIKKVTYDLELITCPHCGKEGTTHGMKSAHFDNCPSLKPVKPKIRCPHCDKEGNDNGYFKSFHINKCKIKHTNADGIV